MNIKFGLLSLSKYFLFITWFFCANYIANDDERKIRRCRLTKTMSRFIVIRFAHLRFDHAARSHVRHANDTVERDRYPGEFFLLFFISLWKERSTVGVGTEDWVGWELNRNHANCRFGPRSRKRDERRARSTGPLFLALHVNEGM